jgi:hypothetical protein
MDEDLDWTGDMTKHHQVPKWLRVSCTEVDAVVASRSVQKAVKKYAIWGHCFRHY